MIPSNPRPRDRDNVLPFRQPDDPGAETRSTVWQGFRVAMGALALGLCGALITVWIVEAMAQ